MAIGPSGPSGERKSVNILPAGDNQKAKVALSRKQGSGEKATWSARCAKALLGAVPQRRFGSFAAAGKGTRPAGRNPPNKKVGATEHVTPTKISLTGAEAKQSFAQSFFAYFFLEKSRLVEFINLPSQTIKSHRQLPSLIAGESSKGGHGAVLHLVVDAGVHGTQILP